MQFTRKCGSIAENSKQQSCSLIHAENQFSIILHQLSVIFVEKKVQKTRTLFSNAFIGMAFETSDSIWKQVDCIRLYEDQFGLLNTSAHCFSKTK